MATVTGAFVLIDRASPTLRSIRREARATDKQLEHLGNTLDRRVASAATLRNLNKTSQAMTNMGRSADQTTRRTDALGSSMKTTERRAGTLGERLRKLGISIAALGKIFGVLKFPVLIAGFGLLTQAVVALGAGAVALLPQIAQLGGALAALPATIGGLGLALVTSKMAFKDLGKAMGGNKKALESMTPEALDFIAVLKEFQPVMKDIRQSAQQGLFPGLAAAMQTLRAGVPMVTRLVNQMGKAMGSAAQQWANQLTNPKNLRDLGQLGNQGIRIFSRMSNSLQHVVQALIHVGSAAKPFTEWLTKMVVRGAEWLALTAETNRRNGKMAAFFDRTKQSMRVFGRILKNVGSIFLSVSKAAGPLGKALWGDVERATKKWAVFSRSVVGQDRMRSFFNRMLTPIRNIAHLFGDLGKALFRIGTGPGLNGMVTSLRSMIPSLEKIVTGMTSAFGPPALELLKGLAALFAQLTDVTGPFGMFLSILGKVAGGFASILREVPLLKTALVGLFSVVLVNRFITRLRLMRGLMPGAAGGGPIVPGGGAGGAHGGPGGGPTVIPGGKGGTRSYMSNRDAYKTARGFGYSAPRAGAAVAASALGTGARAAGRFFLPAAAAMSALDFASTEGGVGRRLHGAASGATLGLIPGPKPIIPGGQRAQEFLAGTPRTRNMAAEIRKQQGALAERVGATKGAVSGGRGGGGQSITIKAHFKVDGKERQELRKYTQELQKFYIANRDIRRQQRGQKSAASVQSAFEYRRGKKGGKAARSGLVDDLTTEFREARGKGKTEFLKMNQDWANELSKGTKGEKRLGRVIRRTLVGEVNQARREGSREFRHLGGNVKSIGEAVASSSRRQWASVRRGIVSPAAKARSEATAHFTALQKAALGTLLGMGLTRNEAANVVKVTESNASNKSPNESRTASAVSAGRNAHGGRLRAGGGRLGGIGLQDNIPVAPGYLAAPGEMIVNRHTEQRINTKLASHGTSLQKEVGNETLPHNAPLRRSYGGETKGLKTGGPAGGKATGSASRAGSGGGGSGGMVRIPGDPSTTGGRDLVAPSIAAEVGSYLKRFGVQVGYAFDPGGGHKSPGHNVTGTALDIHPHTTGWDGVDKAAAAAVKAGKTVYYDGRFGTTNLPPHGRGHHLHVEWGGSGGVAGGAAAAAPVLVMDDLKAPGTKLRGVPGALSSTAGKLMARGMTKAVNKRLKKMAVAAGADAGGAGATSAGGSYNKAALKRIWGQAGGGAGAANTAAAVALAESSGNPNAVGQNNNGSTDRGLWQINSIHGALSTLVPLDNAKAAVSISSGGTNWSPWVAYTNGNYRQYLAKGGRVGMTLSGLASTYADDPKTGYHDSGDNNKPAFQGASNDNPGIAVYNRSTLGGYWSITEPGKLGGQTATVQQTDIGPHPRTGAIFDINAVAARTVFNLPQGNKFPTKQGTWTGKYLGKNAAATPASGTKKAAPLIGLVDVFGAPVSMGEPIAAADPKKIPAGGGGGQAAVDWARSQIGVREVGSNSGKKVLEYLQTVGIGGPAAWCGGFVATAARKGGANPVNGWSYVPTIASLAQNKSGGFRGWTRNPSQAAPGDLLTLRNNGHVEMITSPGKVMKTIGGNTTMPKGGEGVAAKTRSDWTGIAQVQYGSGSKAAMGGRVPFGGWFGDGGSFVANRPQYIGVGEKGRERVTITPQGKGSTAGGINIGKIIVQNHRPGDVKKQIVDEVEAAFNELAHHSMSAPSDDGDNGLI